MILYSVVCGQEGLAARKRGETRRGVATHAHPNTCRGTLPLSAQHAPGGESGPMDTTAPPTGTVTSLFTDIEGSTRLWEQQPQAMQAALARHNALLRQALEVHGGNVFQIIGDGSCAAFDSPEHAVAAN